MTKNDGGKNDGGKAAAEGAVSGSMTTNEVMLSPFYLHPSDRPGDLITTVQLRGENYEDWAKHVRNALRTKRKLGFIEGTVKKPTATKELEQWEIMNIIEPNLKILISMVDEVKELWDDLKLQFSVGNGPRISELRADTAKCQQNGDSVMVYFGKLKKIELKAQLEENREEERLIRFLRDWTQRDLTPDEHFRVTKHLD
ncbi:hypothetical protein EUTSA_v10003354mg [Eutrema salsugineum]|uniref:Retrotransposon Copia-like N-terminal domain-containing protein n=1 Tax=Eutrema salsugineum TaxID=72664 RepID=V4LM25_EUTSA|nr:hypothetical protein EUTSA_v10003354mg [Eutrema salsugineum]